MNQLKMLEIQIETRGSSVKKSSTPKNTLRNKNTHNVRERSLEALIFLRKKLSRAMSCSIMAGFIQTRIISYLLLHLISHYISLSNLSSYRQPKNICIGSLQNICFDNGSLDRVSNQPSEYIILH